MNTIYLGDCLNVLRDNIPGESINTYFFTFGENILGIYRNKEG